MIQIKDNATALSRHFQPNRNQLAALRAYLVDPECFPSHASLAKQIRVSRSAVSVWFQDPDFVRWWGDECLHAARAREGPALLELWRVAQQAEQQRDQIQALTRFLERIEKLPPEAKTAEGFLVELMREAGGDRDIQAAWRDGAKQQEIAFLIKAKKKREKTDAFLERGRDLGLVEGGELDTAASVAEDVAMSLRIDQAQDVVDAELVEDESDVSAYPASEAVSDNNHYVASDEGEGGSTSLEGCPHDVSDPTRPAPPRATLSGSRNHGGPMPALRHNHPDLPELDEWLEKRMGEQSKPYRDCSHGMRLAEMCVRCGWLRAVTKGETCEGARAILRRMAAESEAG